MFNRKGQNILEYSILIALVVGAAVGMQTYVKRGLQGRVKNAVDHVGADAGDVGGSALHFDSAQYEPYYAESNSQITSNRNVGQTWANNGAVNNAISQDETQKLPGSYDRTLPTSGSDAVAN